jgi:hypothetical protein
MHLAEDVMDAKSRLLLLVLPLFLGCASREKVPSQARAPAAQPALEITQTTEVTSAVTSPSGLDPRRMRARIEGRLAELVDRCGALQVGTDRYATKLHLEIDPDGTVQLADARGTNVRLDGCIAEVARTWTFERANARTVTTVPLVLERPHSGR